MILVDMNQVTISNLMIQVKAGDINEELVNKIKSLS